MKKVLIALGLVILIFVAGLAMDRLSSINIEENYMTMSLDDFKAQQGYPSKIYGDIIYVWQSETEVFVGAFVNDELTDYARFDANRHLISGTIPPYQTRFYLILRTLFDPNYQDHIYDTGSGGWLDTAILPNGQLLIWSHGFPGALDGYTSDCFSSEY